MARGKHRSTTPELNLTLKWLESQPEVKKVVLGLTENCRHKYTPGHIKIQRDVDAGIKLKGYSGNGVVDIFVRIEIEHVELIKTQILKRFPE